MKNQLIILAILALTIPIMAQENNEFRHGDRQSEWRKGERPKLTPEQKIEIQERRLQLMEKSLKKIGVTKEESILIFELQKKHQKKIKANMRRSGEARSNLSVLQNSGATEAEMDSAIQEIADAQAEQLKILVRNRIELEKILGKEKYALFMESARTQFRKHGRRGGSGMPPRPRLPSASDVPEIPPVPSV